MSRKHENEKIFEKEQVQSSSSVAKIQANALLGRISLWSKLLIVNSCGARLSMLLPMSIMASSSGPCSPL